MNLYMSVMYACVHVWDSSEMLSFQVPAFSVVYVTDIGMGWICPIAIWRVNNMIGIYNHAAVIVTNPTVACSLR